MSTIWKKKKTTKYSTSFCIWRPSLWSVFGILENLSLLSLSFFSTAQEEYQTSIIHPQTFCTLTFKEHDKLKKYLEKSSLYIKCEMLDTDVTMTISRMATDRIISPIRQTKLQNPSNINLNFDSYKIDPDAIRKTKRKRTHNGGIFYNCTL